MAALERDIAAGKASARTFNRGKERFLSRRELNRLVRARVAASLPVQESTTLKRGALAHLLDKPLNLPKLGG